VEGRGRDVSEILSRDLLGAIEENHETLQS
jgi:hypothetical protein